MTEVRRTTEFDGWLRSLRDVRAAARINIRILRLSLGNPGDVKAVGDGVSEMRINYGPGYRVYFTQRGEVFTLLLWGGDKRSQQEDILRARKMVKEI